MGIKDNRVVGCRIRGNRDISGAEGDDVRWPISTEIFFVQPADQFIIGNAKRYLGYACGLFRSQRLPDDLFYLRQNRTAERYFPLAV